AGACRGPTPAPAARAATRPLRRGPTIPPSPPIAMIVGTAGRTHGRLQLPDAVARYMPEATATSTEDRVRAVRTPNSRDHSRACSKVLDARNRESATYSTARGTKSPTAPRT